MNPNQKLIAAAILITHIFFLAPEALSSAQNPKWTNKHVAAKLLAVAPASAAKNSSVDTGARKTVARQLIGGMANALSALRNIFVGTIIDRVSSALSALRKALLAAVSVTTIITTADSTPENEPNTLELSDGETITQEISAGQSVPVEQAEKAEEKYELQEVEKIEEEKAQVQSFISPIVLKNMGGSGNISGSRTWKVKNSGKFSGKFYFSFTNVTNRENGCNDQEKFAEPNCGSSEIGELGRKLILSLLVNGENYATVRLDASTPPEKIPAFEIKRNDEANITLKWFLGENEYGNEVASDSVNFDFNVRLSAT